MSLEQQDLSQSGLERLLDVMEDDQGTRQQGKDPGIIDISRRCARKLTIFGKPQPPIKFQRIRKVLPVLGYHILPFQTVASRDLGKNFNNLLSILPAK